MGRMVFQVYFKYYQTHSTGPTNLYDYHSYIVLYNIMLSEHVHPTYVYINDYRNIWGNKTNNITPQPALLISHVRPTDIDIHFTCPQPIGIHTVKPVYNDHRMGHLDELQKAEIVSKSKLVPSVFN